MPDNTTQNAGASTLASAQNGTINTSPSAASTPSSTVINAVPSIDVLSNNSSSSLNSQTIQEGEDLYEAVAAMSNLAFLEPISFNDGLRRKISCFLVDKTTMSSTDTLHYIYRERN